MLLCIFIHPKSYRVDAFSLNKPTICASLFCVCLQCCTQKKGPLKAHQVWNQHRRVRRKEVSTALVCRALNADPAVPNVMSPLPPHQVETATPGAQQAAGLRSRGLSRQPAEPRGSHHPGHEHGSALHEGPRQQDSR